MLQKTDLDRDWKEFQTSHLLQFRGGGEVGRGPSDDGGEGEGADAIPETHQVGQRVSECLSEASKHQRFHTLMSDGGGWD